MDNRRWNVLLAFAFVAATLIAGGCGESGSDSGTPEPDFHTSDLAFYHWGANVLGPAKALLPTNGPSDAEVVIDVRRKWIESGRPPAENMNRQFIVQGAEPTRADAIRLAEAEEKAGRAPQGAVVVSEQAISPAGEVMPGPENRGFFVLNNDPALTGADVVEPRLEEEGDGKPVVTFEFTERGRKAYEKLTRDVAEEGQSDCEDENVCRLMLILSSYAVVLDGRVLMRPQVNYIEYPGWLDGDAGFRIDDGLDEAAAEALVTVLRGQ